MTIDRVSGDGRSMRILRGLNANVSFLGCTSDSAKASLVTHVDGSGHQVWNIVQAQAGQGAYNIVVFRGRPGERRSYLSCTPDGTGVELVDHDDGSGRQRWLFDRIAGPVPDYYAIRASISIAGRRPLYLSCTPDGTRVDLFGADDGSGRQRWQSVGMACCTGMLTWGQSLLRRFTASRTLPGVKFELSLLAL